MNFDWEFFQWLLKWYEEHKKQPRKIITEIKWDCFYYNRKIPYSNAPAPIIPVTTNSISAKIIQRGKCKIKKVIRYEISQVTAHIDPPFEQNKDKILLINEHLTSDISKELLKTLELVKREFYELDPLFGLTEEKRQEFYINPWSTDKKKKALRLGREKDEKEALKVLNRIAEREKCPITPPSYATFIEKALCHIITTFIIRHEWINRNFSSKSIFSSDITITVKDLLNSFSTIYNELEFNRLKNIIKFHNREITSFDLIPPIWIKFVQQHIRKDEINLLKKQFSQRYETICQMDANGESPEVIKAVLKSSMPITTEPKEDELSSFKYSPNFRTIYIRNKKYSLTDRQAEIYRILYDARQKGIEELSIAEIFSDLSPEIKPPRLKDIFKSLPEWKELIVTGSKKGVYKLNI